MSHGRPRRSLLPFGRLVSTYRREIADALVGAPLGQPLEVHEKIASTNERAMALARKGVPGGALVVADHQTKGRGRFGRDWIAPPGTAILASVVVRPQLAVERAPLATLAWAAAVRDVLAAESGQDVRVKWPNDVVFARKKLTGILTETILGPAGLDAMVIGFGININQTAGDTPGTSLAIIAGRPFARPDILRKVLDAGWAALTTLEAAGPEKILDTLRRHSSVLGEEVTLRLGEREISGKAVDIDAEGRLVLDTADGLYRAVAGEVTMREEGQ